ncbi:L-threonylcarbamoyladenylate synthase [Neisseria sp. Ec49-e6-T10]|uniref:L-threonylcarbamoyladenylate synthase n=1 Tax=Neisseria sp. Ec49-e6-T10 TaxID=3140744 RepID=UPI003EBAB526
MAHRQLLHLKAHLKRGGVCAYPTESCFGLGGLPTHPAAIRRILKLKKRPAHKGLIVIAHEFKQIQYLLKPLEQTQKQTVFSYWPGPYTFVLEASKRVLPQLRGVGNTNLAVRITAHEPASFLCYWLNSALISTSANVAKARSIKDIRTLKQKFGQNVLVVQAPLGKSKKPSTIIDLKQNKTLRS